MKKDNFSGHVNYSAPELVEDSNDFTQKVDVWGLGCLLYFLITKKDPFAGRDKDNKEEIKLRIRELRIDDNFDKVIPDYFKPLFQKIFIRDENKRPSSS